MAVEMCANLAVRERTHVRMVVRGLFFQSLNDLSICASEQKVWHDLAL